MSKKDEIEQCEAFLKEPFKNYLPDSWYYRWWYIPKCGTPDYQTIFKNSPNQKYCLDMVHGKKQFNAIRFKDNCLDNIVKKYKPQRAFFSFWKEENIDASEQVIRLPLIQHKKNLQQKIDSGHGMFFLVGNAFLMHRHSNVIVYDPFFNHNLDFDIRWFGRLSSFPGTYYLFNMLYSNLSLAVEFKKLDDPFRWIVKTDNFHQFNINIDSKKNELHVKVSSNIMSPFTKKYSLDNKDFICFPLLITFPNGAGHTSNIVYHRSKQTWEHFESNGYIWFWSDYMDDWLETQFSGLITIDGRETLPFKKFYRVKDITPEPSFQALDRKGENKAIDTAQYCATWTYWYLNIRFSNSRHTPPFIVQKIISSIQVKEKRDNYVVFIRSFALVLSRIMDELYVVFSSYYIKSWFIDHKKYQEKIREIFDFYIQKFFTE